MSKRVWYISLVKFWLVAWCVDQVSCFGKCMSLSSKPFHLVKLRNVLWLVCRAKLREGFVDLRNSYHQKHKSNQRVTRPGSQNGNGTGAHQPALQPRHPAGHRGSVAGLEATRPLSMHATSTPGSDILFSRPATWFWLWAMLKAMFVKMEELAVEL